MARILIIISILWAYCGAYSQYKVNETFETASYPPAGWTETDASDIIARSTSASGYGFGAGSLKADFFNVSSGSAILNTPVFNTLTGNDTLSFDYAYAPYTGLNPDSLIVKISTDNGATFSITLASYKLTDIATAPATDFEFAPGASQWATIKLVMNSAVTGNNSLVQFYFSSAFGNDLYIDNIALGNTPVADVQALSVENTGTQYFTSSSITPWGKFRNNGTSSATFNVTRVISPGGYSSTKTVTNLTAGSVTTVMFDVFSFSPGTPYSVRDSVYMPGDGSSSNDTLSASFTPYVAKTVLIYYNDAESKDSLVTHLNTSPYSSIYDVVSMSSYAGSLRSWTTVFVLFGNGETWTNSLRDSLQAFLDNSVSYEQKTLALFGNDISFANDPIVNASASTSDTTFLRQYLHAKYIGDNWRNSIPSAGSTIKGINSLSGLNSGTVSDASPDFVTPVNSGIAGFIPITESGNGDTATAVLFDGTSYNTFFCTNLYSKFSTNTNTFFSVISQWVLDSNGVLPVELSSFTALAENNKVTLNWSTQSEMNNAGFEIERKSSLSGWEKIGYVNGSGNSGVTKDYAYTDNVNLSGKYFYRLKQVDFNGNYRYYNLSGEVVIGTPKNFILKQNFPNPFNPATNIEYEIPFDSKVTINIYDVAGRLAGTLINENQPAGYYRVRLDAGKMNLSSGVYIYRVTSESAGAKFVKSLKMILIK
ncbi:MAG: T9SS type A sorting domain-containing protein [Bacteroidetes bacterium]|nr:T9SS type A sorting domain-containing protein [Bacteroidota bacterium]